MGEHRITAPAGFDGIPLRRNYRFKTRSAADDFRARVKRWKAEKKAPVLDSVEFTQEDMARMIHLRTRLGGDLSQLDAIIDHWERTGKAIIDHKTVYEALDDYLPYLETKLSRKTLGDQRYRLKRFGDHFGSLKLSSLVPADIRTFLDAAPSKTSQHNDFKVLSPFFQWVIEHRWIIINPLAEIRKPKPDNNELGIYFPEAFEALLYAGDRDTLAFIAIAGMAGLRSAELIVERIEDSVLDWSDIDLERAHLVVRPEVSKTDRRRYVKLCPALVEWLKPIAEPEGRVVPLAAAAFRQRLADVHDLSQVRAVRNGLRHSYASYWICANGGEQGIGALAVQMGNSEAIARKHYISVLEPQTGKAWFAIVPPWV